VGLAWLVVGVAACGSSSVDVDPAVAEFVGTWDAVALTVTADAPPNIVADILASGGEFWISVEPSGQYTATLQYFGAHPELGDLTVQNISTLTLHPAGGTPAPSAYVFATPDSLILDGATEFDFNLDFVPEPAQAHFELVRR
jgi:hypothetical protein